MIFSPYPHGTIFSYFYELSYTLDSIMPFDSDLSQKLVQVARSRSSCTVFYRFPNHTILSFILLCFKIFIFAGFTIYIYIYHHHHHHHHHVVPLARISLTLSRHFSLSFIASGRSSGPRPISSHSC